MEISTTFMKKTGTNQSTRVFQNANMIVNSEGVTTAFMNAPYSRFKRKRQMKIIKMRDTHQRTAYVIVCKRKGTYVLNHDSTNNMVITKYKNTYMAMSTMRELGFRSIVQREVYDDGD